MNPSDEPPLNDEPLDPLRLPWDRDFETGHAEMDAQHRALLAQCTLLAERCPGPDGAGSAAAFDAAYAELRRMAQAHFEAEAVWLAEAGSAQREEHLADCEDFGWLADEIATVDNFSRLELQRFLALWWLGHVRSAGTLLQGREGDGPEGA